MKKFVGGSWRSSPATTTWRAREIAEIAWAGCTWEASSKMTTSNQRPGGRVEATTSGLIAQHGLIAVSVVDACGMRSRSGLWRRALPASARTSASWAGWSASTSRTLRATAERTRSTVAGWWARSASANSATSRRRPAPSWAPYAGSRTVISCASDAHQTCSTSAVTCSAGTPRRARSSTTGPRPAARSSSRAAVTCGSTAMRSGRPASAARRSRRSRSGSDVRSARRGPAGAGRRATRGRRSGAEQRQALVQAR